MPETRLVACSPIFETAPYGPPPQGPYLNATAHVATSLAPRALLDGLLAIERRAGRVRGAANAARTLDLDLLLTAIAASTSPGWSFRTRGSQSARSYSSRSPR